MIIIILRREFEGQFYQFEKKIRPELKGPEDKRQEMRGPTMSPNGLR
jgi:hypothetical protein